MLSFLKYLVIGGGAFSFYFKMTGKGLKSRKNICFLVVFSVLFSLVKCGLDALSLSEPFSTILVVEISSVLFAVIDNESFFKTSIRLFLANAICYLLFVFSTVVVSLIVALFAEYSKNSILAIVVFLFFVLLTILFELLHRNYICLFDYLFISS